MAGPMKDTPGFSIFFACLLGKNPAPFTSVYHHKPPADSPLPSSSPLSLLIFISSVLPSRNHDKGLDQRN